MVLRPVVDAAAIVSGRFVDWARQFPSHFQDHRYEVSDRFVAGRGTVGDAGSDPRARSARVT